MKLVKMDLLDVLSTSTTVSGVFTVSSNRDFNVCKSVCVQALQDTQSHGFETPTNSSYFYRCISIKMATVVGAINRFIPSDYVQPACRISLGTKFSSLGLDLETFGLGLGLEDLWPWPWPRRPVALTLASKTSGLGLGLGLDSAVLEHIPAVENVYLWFTVIKGDAVALLVAHRNCNLQVAGLSPGWVPLRSGLGQATCTCVPLSPSSIIWYRPTG